MTKTGQVLRSGVRSPAVWLPIGSIAIEFRCGGTSRDGKSGPTGRESGECRLKLAGEVEARGEQRRARSDWMAVERGISVSSW